MSDDTSTDGEQPPASIEINLSVPEMDCPSCAGKVENSLSRVAGITAMDLRPTAGTATVSYDPDRVDRSAIVEAIESAGYEVTSESAEDDSAAIAPPSEVWTSDRAIKTWIGAAFLVVGLGLTFLSGWNPTLITSPYLDLAVGDLAFLAAVAASGVPVVRGGYYSARNLSLDIDLLMGTAIIAATGIGLFVEAATLAVLFSIAELLEQYAMDQTRDSLRELMELAPDEATVRRDGEEVTVPVEEVGVGETVLVRPGEKIPVDGVVSEGTSAVDQSPITGESVPVDKSEGAEVYAGTINEEGYLEIETTTTEGESTLSQIIDLVQNAQENKTEREQFVDTFAGYYTPAVVVLAICTVLIPPLVIDGTASLAVAGFSHTFVGAWQTWFVRGLTLLVIACPCAFVISTPVSVASGVTAAARNGVLIKGGNHLEAMGEVDAIAFDKTGTLTKGELTVTDAIPIGEHTEEELLAVAGAVEQRSEHPIADAVLDRASEDGVDIPTVEDFESITGKGVSASIDGTRYYVGKPRLFAERDLANASALRSDGGALADASADGETVDEQLQTLQSAGKTAILVGTDETLLGIVGIADEIRPGAKQAIKALKRQGVGPLVMLTGDNEGTARAVATELGLDEYHAELLPEQKVAAIEDLAAEQGEVAMVGDGINDAPALATADVGVAMGAAGTDTAIETADIALMGDDILKVPYLYALAHQANDVIRQNIWSSLGVKVLLAVGVPFGYVSVALAVVVGDMGMSLGVTGNAMRLSRIRPESVLDS